MGEQPRGAPAAVRDARRWPGPDTWQISRQNPMLRPLVGTTFAISVPDEAEAARCAEALSRMGAEVHADAVSAGDDRLMEIASLRRHCRLAREGAALTPLWLTYQCRDRERLEACASPLFRPLPSADGVPAMRTVVITLAGLRGELHRHACLMIQACGARLSGKAWPGRTTHLVCAAGNAMVERRRQRKVRVAAEWNRRVAALGAEMGGASPPSGEGAEGASATLHVAVVRLGWLEACVRAWERVAEAPYALEGDSAHVTLPAASAPSPALVTPTRARAGVAPTAAPGAAEGVGGADGADDRASETEPPASDDDGHTQPPVIDVETQAPVIDTAIEAPADADAALQEETDADAPADDPTEEDQDDTEPPIIDPPPSGPASGADTDADTDDDATQPPLIDYSDEPPRGNAYSDEPPRGNAASAAASPRAAPSASASAPACPAEAAHNLDPPMASVTAARVSPHANKRPHDAGGNSEARLRAVRLRLSGADGSAAMPPRRPRVIQLVGTSDPAHVAAVRDLAARYGGAVIDGHTFDPSCTHVVVVTPKRTEKLLAAIAAGRWLLRHEWVDACHVAGEWLDEADYEYYGEGDEPCGEQGKLLWRGAARAHRQGWERDGRGCFAGQAVLIGGGTQPQPAALERILDAGGAATWTPGSAAPLTLAIVGDKATRRDRTVATALEHGVPCVPGLYVLEQITREQPKTVDECRRF